MSYVRSSSSCAEPPLCITNRARTERILYVISVLSRHRLPTNQRSFSWAPVRLLKRSGVGRALQGRRPRRQQWHACTIQVPWSARATFVNTCNTS